MNTNLPHVALPNSSIEISWYFSCIETAGFKLILIFSLFLSLYYLIAQNKHGDVFSTPPVLNGNKLMQKFEFKFQVCRNECESRYSRVFVETSKREGSYSTS